MTKIVPVRAFFVAALLLAAPCAFAAQSMGADATDGQSELGVIELEAFHNAKVSLIQAIEAAERHAGGGRAVDASFEPQGSTGAYLIRVFRGHAVWEGLVDARTGEVIGQGKTTPENELDPDDKAQVGVLDRVKTLLPDAIRAAEQQGNGKAINGSLEQRNGKLLYEIEIVTDSTVRAVTADALTGRMEPPRPESGSSRPAR